MRHRKRKKASGQTLTMTVLVVVSIALLMVIACAQVFVVRDIMVIGNRNLPAEAVITQSGVQVGDNLLSITASLLEARLEQNRYIEYVGHEFDYRGTLTIRIDERLGMGVIYELGLYYVMDEKGMVLECAGNSYPSGVAGPKVSGLQFNAHSRIVVGEIVPVRDERKLEEMARVLLALDETNLLSRTSELNLSNLSNLSVMTSDGTKIELGDSSNLNTKLLIAREVLALRESEGELKGVKIDVSSGRNAHYIPALLPTITPTPTATPTYAPSATPQ